MRKRSKFILATVTGLLLLVMAGMLAVGVIGLALDIALRRTEAMVKARWGQA